MVCVCVVCGVSGSYCMNFVPGTCNSFKAKPLVSRSVSERLLLKDGKNPRPTPLEKRAKIG